MRHRRGRLGRVLLAGFLFLLPALARPISAQEVPVWPSEQEQRLKELDSQLLDLQRSRFAAVFGTDKQAAKRLDKQFLELQKQRRQLLRSTGRLP